MADKDEQLPFVLFLEVDVLAVIHSSVLERIDYHDVGAFLSPEADAEFFHILVVNQQELLVYVHHSCTPDGILHGAAGTFLHTVVCHTAKTTQILAELEGKTGLSASGVSQMIHTPRRSGVPKASYQGPLKSITSNFMDKSSRTPFALRSKVNFFFCGGGVLSSLFIASSFPHASFNNTFLTVYASFHAAKVVVASLGILQHFFYIGTVGQVVGLTDGVDVILFRGRHIEETASDAAVYFLVTFLVVTKSASILRLM